MLKVNIFYRLCQQQIPDYDLAIHRGFIVKMPPYYKLSFLSSSSNLSI